MRLTLRNLLRFLDVARMDPLERGKLEELVAESDKARTWIALLKSGRAHQTLKAPELDGPPSIDEVTRYLADAMTHQEAIAFEDSIHGSSALLAEISTVHWLLHRPSAERAAPVPVALRQTLYDIDRVYAGDAKATPSEAATVPAGYEDLPFVDPDDGTDERGDGTTGLNTHSGEQADEGVADVSLPPVSLEQMRGNGARRAPWMIAVSAVLAAGLIGLAFWLGYQRGEQQTAQTGDDPPAAATADEPDRDEDDRGGDDPAGADKARDTMGDGAASDENSQIGDAGSTSTKNSDSPGPDPETDSEDGNERMPLPPRANIAFAAGNDDNGNEVDVTDENEPLVYLGPMPPPHQVLRSEQAYPFAMVREKAGEVWRPTAVETQLAAGAELVVLAGTECEYQFGKLLRLQVEGPARLRIGTMDPGSRAERLIVDYGKIRVTSSESDVDWLVDLDGLELRVNMVQANSECEVELRRHYFPGDHPEQKQPDGWFVVSTRAGRTRVWSHDRQWNLPATVALRGILPGDDVKSGDADSVLQSGVLAMAIAKPRYVERIADSVETLLAARNGDESNFEDWLSDRRIDRRQEIRLAAVVWSHELGYYDGLVDFFGEEDNRSNWRSALEGVRQSIVNDASQADTFFQSLAFLGSELQDRWYRLIVGLGPAELEEGGDRWLVEALGDDLLSVRVLAIENLRMITGGITFSFQPYRRQLDRRRIIEDRWEPALEEGRIRYRDDPAMTPPVLTPVAAEDGGIGLDDLSTEPPLESGDTTEATEENPGDDSN